MTKSTILISAFAITFLSCQKPDVTVYTGQPTPSYLVSGVHDIILTNGSSSYINMPITVQYSDSAQETVSLALSSLPANIAMDSTAVMTGVPSFSTNFIFYDTTQNGATPGSYPMTLTATGSRTGARTFKFNLRVLPQPSYTANIVGLYANSQSYCQSGTYSDSVWNDANIVNKIWFKNFGNYGISIYARVNSAGNIIIPSQTVNGYTVSGSGYLSFSSSSYYLSFSSITVKNGTNTNYCTITMNH